MSSGLSLANLFTKQNPHDVIKTPQSAANIAKNDETGMDRLKAMFSRDQDGYQSKEITMITQLSTLSFFGSFMLGGIIRSKDAFVTFIENNTATKFQNHLEAKRQVQRVVFLSFMNGGWRLGWRIGLFSFSFTTLLTSISVYRGKESLVEYIVAGGTTGGLFRMSLGLKGMVSGAVVGSALGTVAGSVSLIVLKISGFSMSDIRDFTKIMHVYRQNAIKENRKKALLEEHTDFADSESDGKLSNDSN